MGKEESKMFHKLHVLGMNDDLWDRVHGYGSKIYGSVCILCSCVSMFRL